MRDFHTLLLWVLDYWGFLAALTAVLGFLHPGRDGICLPPGDPSRF
jgi:hypothetical protein